MTPASSDPQEPQSRERQPRADGTLGAAVRRPWARWHAQSSGDKLAAVLSAAAMIMAATALVGGSSWGEQGAGAFPIVAPLVSVLLVVAQVVMLTRRERHGEGRVLLAVGAALLALSAAYFTPHVDAGRVLAAYWLPSLLSLSGAIALAWGRSRGQVQAHAHPNPLRSESSLRGRGR